MHNSSFGCASWPFHGARQLYHYFNSIRLPLSRNHFDNIKECLRAFSLRNEFDVIEYLSLKGSVVVFLAGISSVRPGRITSIKTPRRTPYEFYRDSQYFDTFRRVSVFECSTCGTLCLLHGSAAISRCRKCSAEMSENPSRVQLQTETQFLLVDQLSTDGENKLNVLMFDMDIQPRSVLGPVLL